jgi:hypothetical protein
MRQFLWGVLFGVVLVPLMYILNLRRRERTKRVEFDDSDWI